MLFLHKETLIAETFLFFTASLNVMMFTSAGKSKHWIITLLQAEIMKTCVLFAPFVKYHHVKEDDARNDARAKTWGFVEGKCEKKGHDAFHVHI